MGVHVTDWFSLSVTDGPPTLNQLNSITFQRGMAATTDTLSAHPGSNVDRVRFLADSIPVRSETLRVLTNIQ